MSSIALPASSAVQESSNELVYPHERTLGTITLVIGVLIWLGLVIGTFGGALLALALGFVLYLFAQSALIAHIKGNGVELSEAQFPDLHAQFVACCDRLQMKVRPQAYVLNGNGGLNAFATKFLGTQFVVLMSDVVDAMGIQGRNGKAAAVDYDHDRRRGGVRITQSVRLCAR